MNLVGPARIVLEAFGRRRNLDLARLEDRLAVVQRLEPRNLVSLLEQLLADLPYELAALARRQLAPRPIERRARRRHGRVNIRFVRRRDLGDHLFGRRVDDLDRLPANGIAPFVVDEELFAHHCCRWHRYHENKCNHENTKTRRRLKAAIISL